MNQGSKHGEDMENKLSTGQIAAIVVIGVIGVLVGLFLLLVLAFASLPGYVQIAVMVAYILLLAFFIRLILRKQMKWKAKRVSAWLLCIGFAICVVTTIPYIYDESVPVMDDRMLMIEDYQPYAEGSKVMKLDEPSTLLLDADCPKIDCATALYPVAASFVNAVYPKEEYSPYDEDSGLLCSGTTEAYESIINGTVDVILVAGPSEQQLKVAAAKGIELNLTPIGKEAFVFFVNNNNPVEDLSVEQVQGIYGGEITNWSQVGGRNEAIRAFQRDEGSGSQTALQNLMAGKTLAEPIKDDIVDAMAGIIEQVADYKNYKNAIGFSFRFYSTEMVESDDIKLLALNGVEPNKQTIEDDSYPVASEFYAVTVKGKETENTKKLVEWMQSPQGQLLIEQTGYVPLS